MTETLERNATRAASNTDTTAVSAKPSPLDRINL